MKNMITISICIAIICLSFTDIEKLKLIKEIMFYAALIRFPLK